MSGIKGANFNEKNGMWKGNSVSYQGLHKWVARIAVNNKKIYLGSFIEFADAVKARKEAEIKYEFLY